jgi:PAS domain S-box-containing protein
MPPKKDSAGKRHDQPADHTEVHRRVEDAVQSGNRRFRALIENSADAITLLDAQGVAIYDSPAAPGMLGYAADEWIGKNVFELLHPDDLPKIQELFQKLVAGATGARVNSTFRLHHQNGAWLWIEAVATNLLAEPSVKAIVVNYRDITERKLAEESLRESEEKYRMLVEKMSEGLIVVDNDDVIQFVNNSFTRLVGYSREELLGQVAYNLVIQEEDQELIKEKNRLRLEQKSDEYEIRMKTKSGGFIWVRISGVPVLDVQGNVVGSIGINTDITKHKQAEEEIRLQLSRLASLRKIDEAISGTMDINLILNTILEQVISQLGVDAADVLLYDRATDFLQYAAGVGFHTDTLQHTRLPLGESYAGRVATQQQMVYIAGLQTRKTDFLRSYTFAQEGFVSYFGIPLVTKGEIQGVLEIFHRTAFEAKPEWLSFLETLAGQAAIAIDNATLFKNLQLSNVQLTEAYDATIAGWSRAIELRDKETNHHTRRVTEMTEKLARAMGIGKDELLHIRHGALLHDIGKIGVPDGILLKPGPLTEAEWAIMRHHPQYAYDLLSAISYLKPALDIPHCHHEKWDGTGYPRGLKGEEIPLAARIFAVVDVWDALRSDRPYRPAWPEEKVLEHIRALAGTHFDPQAVELFLRVMSETTTD